MLTLAFKIKVSIDHSPLKRNGSKALFKAQNKCGMHVHGEWM